MAKFYELPMSERLQQLGEAGLDANDMFALSSEGGLGAEQADHMIENVVGIRAAAGHRPEFCGQRARSVGADGDRRTFGGRGASFMAKLAAHGGGFPAHTDRAGDDRADADAGCG